MTKELEFKYVNNGARRDFLALPREIVNQFGSDINAVQHGQRPFSEFEDLPSIGPGVIELKENGKPAFRVVYCAKHLDTVYLLHAFTKTTNGVDRQAMSTLKQRYKEMLAEVAELKKQQSDH